MKTLLLSSIVFTTLFLAGCSDKTTTLNNENAKTPPSIVQEKIPENEEHGHNEQGDNVAKNDPKNMDGMGHGDVGHATIISEEQFIAEMIPHHQEAIETAKIIVAKGENPTLKKIAQAIVDGQSKEVTMLNGWLQSRFPNSNYKASYKNMMRPLANLKDHDLEDSFMEDMIKHHEGAITMAKQVLEVSQRPEIVQFANDVINVQSSEITEFQKLLDAKDRH